MSRSVRHELTISSSFFYLQNWNASRSTSATCSSCRFSRFFTLTNLFWTSSLPRITACKHPDFSAAYTTIKLVIHNRCEHKNPHQVFE